MKLHYTHVLPAAALLVASIGPQASVGAAAPATGAIVAWGDNSAGQLNVPPGLTDVIAISAGDQHSLALRSNGTVVAWGCGGTPTGACQVPAGLAGVTAVSAGSGISLALKSDGTLVEWGCTCGIPPAGLSDVVAISAGGDHSLALRRNGTVVEWPDVTVVDPRYQSPPPNVNNLVAVSASFNTSNSHNLGLTSDGTAISWGDDLYNTIGTFTNVKAISAGYFQSLVLLSDGTVAHRGCAPALFALNCFPPAGLNNVAAISVGTLVALALKTDGTIVAWGADVSGLLTPPPATNGAIAISAGGRHALALVPVRAGSVGLNGTTGYLETPNAADLNITGNWTVEAWFKDDDPNGFNHDNRTILAKGDSARNAEVPYLVQVGHNNIIAGVRAGNRNQLITWDLLDLGVDPSSWHHVAVSFDASLNVLNLWIDGQHIAYLGVTSHPTTGNRAPLDLGRKGPTTGDYWIGKLDDVRIWNVARRGTDISATYLTQFTSPQPGLVANWRLDDQSGSTAVDNSGNNHTATLFGGASFLPDGH